MQDEPGAASEDADALRYRPVAVHLLESKGPGRETGREKAREKE